MAKVTKSTLKKKSPKEKKPRRTMRHVKKGKFLEVFIANGGRVPDAAAAVGVQRATPHLWKNTDPEFAKAWKEAELFALQTLEQEAVRRAVDGTVRPVFHKGEECGGIREYSDTLLIFLMKARDPMRYRDNPKPQDDDTGRGIDVPIRLVLKSDDKGEE